MEVELKPCPFCGSTSVEMMQLSGIVCWDCGLSVATLNSAASKDMLAERYNRRVLG